MFPCLLSPALQVIVFKMKPKKHYRRTNGHRQPLSKILVRGRRGLGSAWRGASGWS